MTIFDMAHRLRLHGFLWICLEREKIIGEKAMSKNIEKRKADREKRRKKLKREITDAMNYRVDGLYVGGIASCKVIKALDGVYGEDSVSDLLENAETPELKAAHTLLKRWGFIQLGKERKRDIEAGERFCPHCGGKL